MFKLLKFIKSYNKDYFNYILCHLISLALYKTNTMNNRITTIIIILCSLSTFSQNDTYWGNNVPENWNGEWPVKLQTKSEKANFSYTANHEDVLDYFSMLKWNSENVHVFNMFTSDLGRTSPVLVMSNPRISTPEEAKESGKTVVYLQGGIHPGECEGKEALFMVIRDVLFGKKKYLLDNLIIMVNPNFNVDGNETRVVNDDYPILNGTRRNAAGYDVNRDGIKLQTLNMQGAYENVLNKWDPTLIFDTHRMGGTRHGYAIAQAGSNVVTAHKGPRDYVTYTLFPAIVDEAKKSGNIDVGMHCGLNKGWPPTEFTHDNSIWSTEAKFMVNAYGLRNRMAILVETPGGEAFEKAIFSQYEYTKALLEVCYRNGKEMQAVCKAAEEEVVKTIKNKASSGTLMNYVSGKYVSDGKISMPAYRDRKKKQLPGTSVFVLDRPNPPEMIHNVDLITKPVGTKEAKVPRGYLILENLEFIVEKLKRHGVIVTQLEHEVKANGEEFVFNKMYHKPMGFANYQMTTLDGSFNPTSRTFPKGTYHIDMAQPFANVVFYALEPEVRDGFLGWNLMDDYLTEIGANNKEVAYPIFKYFIKN